VSAREASAPHLPRESWDAYLDDRLDGEPRARIEAHLAECAECRAWVASIDPSHLFHRLRTPVPAPAWDGFWEAIQQDLGTARPKRRATWRLFAAAAALAAIALVAVVARTSRNVETAEDPCSQATLAALNLTRPITEEECRLLHEGMAVEEAPVIITGASIDLRGL